MPTLAEVLDFIKAAKKGAATKISDLINQDPQQLSMEGRANFLPYQDTLPGSVMNQRSWALPGIAAGGINAITAPRRAMQGVYEADESGNITPTFNAPEEAQNVSLSMLGGGGVASRGAPAGSLGMNVWHGSPHRFPPTAKNPLGEFDPTKIGTGEGAQAYGVGAGYLAEHPEVARGYAQNVRAKTPSTNFKLPDGRDVRLINGTDWYLGNQPITHDTATNLWIKAGNNQSNLYKVDLPDEHIAKMLDWDKPLSQQSADVKKAISSDPRIARLIASGKIDDMYQSGGEFYRAVNSKYANDAPAHISLDAAENAAQANASRYLKSLGIPGIRYLDGSSRAGGKGTSNFVVFDPKHMNIIGRE